MLVKIIIKERSPINFQLLRIPKLFFKMLIIIDAFCRGYDARQISSARTVLSKILSCTKYDVTHDTCRCAFSRKGYTVSLFHDRAIPLRFFTKGLYHCTFSQKGYTVVLYHERSIQCSSDFS